MDDGNSVKRRRTANDSSAGVVFEYAGEGCFIPKNVVRVKFHPSVVQVPPHSSSMYAIARGRI